MNYKINKHSLLLLLPALLLFSCMQEDMPGAADDSRIVFRVSMAEVGARATATMATDILKDGFYVTAFCPEANVTGALKPYFAEQEAKLLDKDKGYFGMFDEQSSDPEPEQWGWPSSRHSKEGRLKFFAFYPSRQALRDNARVTSDEYFRLENNSKKQGTTVTYDYRIKKFKVNKDITNHLDFVTATAEGTKLANSETGVKLAFEHQLSRITLKAWGNTPNDIEIAGMRIGWIITESDFNFAEKPKNLAVGDATLNGDWVVGTQTKECLEYIFQAGDVVVKIGNGNHIYSDSAASIMGKGELATVIPADYKGWNHGSDAPNKNKRIYFSVLLRVKESNESKTMVYPYVIGGNISSSLPADAMSVVFLSVKSKTGEVTKRVYRNKDNHTYYTDPGFTEVYNLPEGEEIRNYGWAAIPLADKRCKPGYHYTYTLDYSQGVGVHDPDDPLPGTPIISKILVGVTEGENKWPVVVGDFTAGGTADITKDIIMN